MNTNYIIEKNGYVNHNPYFSELEARMHDIRRQNFEKDKLKRMNAMNADVGKFTVKVNKVNRRNINNIEYDIPNIPSAYRKIKF